MYTRFSSTRSFRPPRGAWNAAPADKTGLCTSLQAHISHSVHTDTHGHRGSSNYVLRLPIQCLAPCPTCTPCTPRAGLWSQPGHCPSSVTPNRQDTSQGEVRPMKI